MEELVLAVLDTSRRIADPWLAKKCRSLTLDWSRFKHSGPRVEAADLGAVLAAARARGARYCLVQSYGHVLAEIWRPEGAPSGDALEILGGWFPGRGLLAAGRRQADGTLDLGCVMVDLERWEALGRPSLDAPGFERSGLPVAELPPELEGAAVHLRPEDPAAAAELRRLLDAGIDDFDPEAPSALAPDARRFVGSIRHLVSNLRRGVFVWNIEPYADVETPPDGFRGPLDALYSVAAGLKPNRLLETHGFDAGTRVVYFDYSQPGLRFRRLLLETWDGRDYPSFLSRLFAALPPEEAHYCLWEGATPDNLDWDAVAERWRGELDAWGGESILARHWARYRTLPHAFVHGDLLADRGALLATLEDRPAAAIWWSNAFFSVVSNWFHTAGERRAIYRRFLDELAEAAPRLLLYGASSDNVAVNGVRAAEYRSWFRDAGGDELAPGRLHRCEMKF